MDGGLMIKYYGIEGENMFGLDDSNSPELWAGYIEMKGPRPNIDHYATKEGEWVKRSDVDVSVPVWPVSPE
ncbi:hypothetical protein OU751_002568 [Yersinia enterocolitica]|nr:hypothetical protein [Yersinia enterocolitica]